MDNSGLPRIVMMMIQNKLLFYDFFIGRISGRKSLSSSMTVFITYTVIYMLKVCLLHNIDCKNKYFTVGMEVACFEF